MCLSQGVARWLQRVWKLVHGAVEAHAQGIAAPPTRPKVDRRLRSEVHTAIKVVTHAFRSASLTLFSLAFCCPSISFAFAPSPRPPPAAHRSHTHSFNAAVGQLMRLSNELANDESHTPAFFGELQPPACGLPADQTSLCLPSRAEGLRVLVAMMSPMAPHVAAELWSQMKHLPPAFFDPKVRLLPCCYPLSAVPAAVPLVYSSPAVPPSAPSHAPNSQRAGSRVQADLAAIRSLSF
jgi:hypothetical protein